MTLPVVACTDVEHSICQEHMGSNVTVYADGYPEKIYGEMFYCFKDGGFMIIMEDETMVSIPYHSVSAVLVTENDFLIPIPE